MIKKSGPQPSYVDAADYKRLVHRASLAAVCTAIFLILIKVVVVVLSNSLSLYASLMDSVFDLGSSAVNLLILRQASKPADDDHTFGHGKFEYFGIVGQGIFIGTSALFLLVNAIQRLDHPATIHLSALSFIILLITIVATFILTRYQAKIVYRTNSDLVKADFMHYNMDMFMNLSVIAALFASSMGYVRVDSFLALAIAAYMLYSVLGMFKAAYIGLTDVVLPEADLRVIRAVVQQHSQVISIHELRTRQSANTKYIQFHLELDDKLTLLQTHDICDEIETAILAVFSDAMITIHPEPHSVAEQERLGTYQAKTNEQLIEDVRAEL